MRYIDFQSFFSPGRLAPFEVMISTGITNGVKSDSFYDIMCALASRFQMDEDLTLFYENIISISTIGQQKTCLSWAVAQQALKDHSAYEFFFQNLQIMIIPLHIYY